MSTDYTLLNLNEALKSLVTKENEVVFITGNIAALGRSDTLKKNIILSVIYDSIMDVSENITIVVPSLTMNLCNTDIPFEKSTYTNMGAFSNYILKKKDSIRSLHPFASYTAIGKKASFICSNSSTFSYGINTPYDRILQLSNPICISIGIPPNLTSSIIHHVEFNMHVPYRYIKEFKHPIMISNEVIYQNFYLHVLYRDLNEKRNLNVKAFKYFESKHGQIEKTKIGKNVLYKYKLDEFYKNSIKLYTENIYSWLDEEPTNKPYRK